jgi:hypothetical protein
MSRLRPVRGLAFNKILTNRQSSIKGTVPRRLFIPALQ